MAEREPDPQPTPAAIARFLSGSLADAHLAGAAEQKEPEGPSQLVSDEDTVMPLCTVATGECSTCDCAAPEEQETPAE